MLVLSKNTHTLVGYGSTGKTWCQAWTAINSCYYQGAKFRHFTFLGQTVNSAPNKVFFSVWPEKTFYVRPECSGLAGNFHQLLCLSEDSPRFLCTTWCRVKMLNQFRKWSTLLSQTWLRLIFDWTALFAIVPLEHYLTHFWPIFLFYNPWKHQKIKGFLVFLRGYKMGTCL